MFGGPQSSAVAVHGHSDEHWSNEGSEVSSDTTERESKVHALGEEGVHPPRHPARQVTLQYMQKIIHLYHKHTYSTVHRITMYQ